MITENQWRIMALICEKTQTNEFIKMDEIRPKGTTIHEVLEVLKSAGMERVGTWWTPGEKTCDWLCLHLHGIGADHE